MCSSKIAAIDVALYINKGFRYCSTSIDPFIWFEWSIFLDRYLFKLEEFALKLEPTD